MRRIRNLFGQHLSNDLIQGAARGQELRHDFFARTVFVEHALHAAHLTLGATQTVSDTLDLSWVVVRLNE